MSTSDIKHNLRKMDFPACSREALIKIEHLIAGRSSPSTKHLDLAMDIIKEFVFCENDRRGQRRVPYLNPLQELQLIDVLREYFTSDIGEIVKNTIFLSLFDGSEMSKRMGILSKLASMAMSALLAPLLLVIGTWIQQTGCSSPLSLELAEAIVRDHFKLHQSNENSLKSLAIVAPQFVANFMASVTEIHLRKEDGHCFTPPPRNLLQVITAWVYSNPTLCLSAQLNPASLPSGGIPMAAITPLAGLIQWCTLAPLYTNVDSDSTTDTDSAFSNLGNVKKIKLESTAGPSALDVAKESDTDLYSKLHLGVLQSLFEGRKPLGPPTAVNAQHLASVVWPIQACAAKMLSQGTNLNADSRLKTSLNRIAQATQIALANNCVYGNVQSLLSLLETLPENRLLRIVIKKHRQLT